MQKIVNYNDCNKKSFMFFISVLTKFIMKDKKGVEIRKGSIVNIRQTVNGQKIFVVLEVEPLDIVYSYDLNRKYEYDKQELLDMHTDSKEVEVIGNVYDFFANVC